MKKFLLVSSLILAFAAVSTAQVYEVGLSGFINNGYLVNDNVQNRGSEQGLAFHTDFNYGISGVWYFSYYHGMQLEFNYGDFTQEYSGLDEVLGWPHQFRARTTLKTVNIPFSWRIGFNDYLEVGVMPTFITKANYEFSDSDENYSYETTSAFNGMNFSAFVGMGASAEITDRWRISTSLRGFYGFSDLKGVDGFGNDLNDTDNPMLYNDDPEADALYLDYEPTQSLMFGFKIGLIYRIPGKNSPLYKG